MNCLYCGHSLNGKRQGAKFCSHSHQVMFARKRQQLTDTDKRQQLTDNHRAYRCPDCGLKFRAIDAQFEGPLFRFSTEAKAFVQVQAYHPFPQEAV